VNMWMFRSCAIWKALSSFYPYPANIIC